MEKSSAENNAGSACKPSSLKRLILLLLSIVAGSPLLHAQALWQTVPFNNPTSRHLTPYTPPTTPPTAGSLEEAQQKVSKSIAFLAIPSVGREAAI